MPPLAIGRRLTSPAGVHDFGKRLLKHEENKPDGIQRIRKESEE